MHEPYTLQIWPIRREPMVSLTWIFVAIATALIVRQSTGEALWGVVAGIAVMAAVWRVFVPVTVRLTSEGIYQSLFGWERFCPWTSICWYRAYPSGVMLFLDADRSMFAALRGLFLPYGEDRGELVRIIEEHLQDETSFELAE